MNNASRASYGFGSPTSTESSTPILTPSASRASSIISQSTSTSIPSGPLALRSLSTTSWRQPYPSVGQFAVTEGSEEVVAAGPNGLFYFKRVQDHDTTPWSEPRPLPSGQVTLNDFTVSGLALHSGYPFNERRLYLYCVSGGALYSFYSIDKDDFFYSFLPDASPPLPGCRVMGKPTVVQNRHMGHYRWSLVVPCQSGGLLHTWAMDPGSNNGSLSTKWEAPDRLATNLGLISAVSVTTVPSIDHKTELVAVCISGGQLNVVQVPFEQYGYLGSLTWERKTPTRILHPGEVTGNPVLITNLSSYSGNQLDLLVPSAEGGIFHFVRTDSALNDWHMIGRVAFPQNVPPASCLSFHSRPNNRGTGGLYALVQIGGRLYHVKTTNTQLPWSNARLNPIVQPGPFLE